MSLLVDVGMTLEGFALDVKLALPAGQTVAIVGPNGAGKSTLVGLIAGITRPDRGSIRLAERTLDDVDAGLHLAPRKRAVGVSFQERRLFPSMTVLENVAFPLRARGVGRTDARRRAHEALERMGMADRADAMPDTLSGGEQQRVALARAIIGEPDLLLLDEPLAAIDMKARADIRDLLSRELARFPGVRLLVSHDPTDAMTLADGIVVIERGRVVQIGTPEEIRDAPATAWAAEFVGLNRFRGRLEPLEEGAGRIVTDDGGEVIVAWPADVPRGPVEGVIALLRPSDVALSISAPTSGSARNMLRGTIASISSDAQRARIRIDARPAVVAEVTLGSVERLRLVEGAEIWASFKAVEPRLLVEQDH